MKWGGYGICLFYNIHLIFVLQELLNKLLDASKKGYFGLCQDIMEKEGKIVTRLILQADEVKNVQISNNGGTLLHWLAEKGHMTCYKKVVVYSGVNNPKDFDGNTPEMVALMHQHYAMVRLLSKLKDENVKSLNMLCIFQILMACNFAAS